MIKGMKFLNEHDADLAELTNHTVFMCDSTEIKETVADLITNTYIKHTENSVRFNDGVDWIEDVNCKRTINFPQTTLFEFSDEFKLVVTVENAFVFSIDNIYDLWFVRKQNDKLIFIPLTNFAETLNAVSLYKSLSVGRFSIDGTYGR